MRCVCVFVCVCGVLWRDLVLFVYVCVGYYMCMVCVRVCVFRSTSSKIVRFFFFFDVIDGWEFKKNRQFIQEYDYSHLSNSGN